MFSRGKTFASGLCLSIVEKEELLVFVRHEKHSQRGFVYNAKFLLLSSLPEALWIVCTFHFGFSFKLLWEDHYVEMRSAHKNAIILELNSLWSKETLDESPNFYGPYPLSPNCTLPLLLNSNLGMPTLIHPLSTLKEKKTKMIGRKKFSQRNKGVIEQKCPGFGHVYKSNPLFNHEMKLAFRPKMKLEFNPQIKVSV